MSVVKSKPVSFSDYKKLIAKNPNLDLKCYLDDPEWLLQSIKINKKVFSIVLARAPNSVFRRQRLS